MNRSHLRRAILAGLLVAFSSMLAAAAPQTRDQRRHILKLAVCVETPRRDCLIGSKCNAPLRLSAIGDSGLPQRIFKLRPKWMKSVKLSEPRPVIGMAF